MSAEVPGDPILSIFACRPAGGVLLSGLEPAHLQRQTQEAIGMEAMLNSLLATMQGAGHEISEEEMTGIRAQIDQHMSTYKTEIQTDRFQPVLWYCRTVDEAVDRAARMLRRVLDVIVSTSASDQDAEC